MRPICWELGQAVTNGFRMTMMDMLVTDKLHGVGFP